MNKTKEDTLSGLALGILELIAVQKIVQAYSCHVGKFAKSGKAVEDVSMHEIDEIGEAVVSAVSRVVILLSLLEPKDIERLSEAEQKLVDECRELTDVVTRDAKKLKSDMFKMTKALH